MIIELKSIDLDKESSESAFAFSAKLYIDGKYIADVSNSGKDKVNTVEPKTAGSVEVLKDAERFCASHYIHAGPKEGDLINYEFLERYVDKIMFDHLNRVNLESQRTGSGMKKINASIDELTKFLYGKGYDGLFTLEGKGPQKLPDLLKGYMAMAIADPMTLTLPVKVYTITSLADSNGKYNRCAFEVDYNSRDKVHVKYYELQLIGEGEKYPVFRHFHEIKHRSEIPEKSSGIKMAAKSLKRSKKGYRFY